MIRAPVRLARLAPRPLRRQRLDRAAKRPIVSGVPREHHAPDLARRVVAEAVGTAFLLAAVVGSGIMGERLAGGNIGLALLANTLATGAG